MRLWWPTAVFVVAGILAMVAAEAAGAGPAEVAEGPRQGVVGPDAAAIWDVRPWPRRVLPGMIAKACRTAVMAGVHD